MEVDLDFTDNSQVELSKKEIDTRKSRSRSNLTEIKEDKRLINCLQNKKITVRFIPRESGLVTDPKHILYGGMHINAKFKLVVPRLQNGTFVNVLTNSEKEYLEYVMGLEENALSVYRKTDNFWSNYGVILTKGNTTLDLSVPDDYIKYKVLLANKDYIAPSDEELNRRQLPTYRYVLSSESGDYELANKTLNTNAKAYKIFGQLESSPEKLALVVELSTGKVVNYSNKELLLAAVDKLIREYPLKFIENAEDEYLDIKLLIKQAVETGHVRKRGQYYYLTEDNSPLCTERQEPTIQAACQYLNSPKYQEKKFYLESKVRG